jgi:hypothetical protein
MASSDSVPTLVIYRPKPGAESALEALIRKHLPTLKKPRAAGHGSIRGVPRGGQAVSRRLLRGDLRLEGRARLDVAHQTPEVMAIWEPMGTAAGESRDPALQPL